MSSLTLRRAWAGGTAMGDLGGRVAFVTGAGSGIGAASSLLMGVRGARVVVTDINLDAAKHTASAVVDAGGESVALQLDVGDPAAIEMAISETIRDFGGIDVVFCSAATTGADFVARDTNVVETDLETWETALRVNLTGAMLPCKYAIPSMIERGGGSIILMSSGAATHGSLRTCAYGASKGGVESMVKYIATAFGRDGVRCNGIAPGIVMTEGNQRIPPEALEEFRSHHVTPRLGVPEDVASLVAFLASDESEFLTGQIIPLDGGLFAHLPTYAWQMRSGARS